MKVKTLRRHDNTYGDKYEKHPGKVYDHPNPKSLIDAGIVEAADVADVQDRGAAGAGAGAKRTAKGDSA